MATALLVRSWQDRHGEGFYCPEGSQVALVRNTNSEAKFIGQVSLWVSLAAHVRCKISTYEKPFRRKCGGLHAFPWYHRAVSSAAANLRLNMVMDNFGDPGQVRCWRTPRQQNQGKLRAATSWSSQQCCSSLFCASSNRKRGSAVVDPMKQHIPGEKHVCRFVPPLPARPSICLERYVVLPPSRPEHQDDFMLLGTQQPGSASKRKVGGRNPRRRRG